MRGNEFLDKMELIDPALVAAADEQPGRKRFTWLKWGGLAACVCLAAAASLFALAGPGGTGPGSIISREPESPGVDAREHTSDTYQSLEELLDYLSRHDGHGGDGQQDVAASRPKLEGREGADANSAALQTGRDTVSYDGLVYQIIDGEPSEKLVGIFRSGVQVGTVELGTPPEELFLYGGRLIVVGRRQGGAELDPEPEDYGVAVSIFDLTGPHDLAGSPERPALLDTFHLRGASAACWAAEGRLWLITVDGVCACGWSRLDDPADYKPRLTRNGEEIPWPEEDIRILGEPSQVKYAAAVCIDLDGRTVAGKRACYGNISDVYFGADWFALVTSSMNSEEVYALPEVYAFDGSMAFMGRCRTAAAFGLEGGGALGWFTSRPAEYPLVQAVSRSGDVWRIVGEYHKNTGSSWSRELFAIAFSGETGETVLESIQLPEEQFDIDDVVWEDGRAIISAGFTRFGQGPDDVEHGARLVFAQFDGMEITLLASDLVCGRVSGVSGFYWYGSPLGYLKPFIPLGDGIYLRYNEIPDGFDLYDLSDSANPRRLYQSQGDIPEGCRLDFGNRVLDSRTVAVQLITASSAAEYYGDRDSACRWAVFTIDPGADSPVALREEQYPLTGTDPAAIAP